MEAKNYWYHLLHADVLIFFCNKEMSKKSKNQIDENS